MDGPPVIFDRRTVRRHRTRAADRSGTSSIHAILKDRLLDRLHDVTRTFESALVCGPQAALVVRDLKEKHGVAHAVSGSYSAPPGLQEMVSVDDEWLPFADHSFDLAISIRALHWVNDLPGALIQLRRSLKPDGLLLASLFGGQTLHELADCLVEAESELRGGLSPRVSPFVDVRDAGNLLLRAGFALPVTDSDAVTVEYESLASLMRDLKVMGETNAVRERSKALTTPALFALAEEIYRSRHASPSGMLKATFDIITLTGWSPADTQQKPLRPGSASGRLSDALSTDETSL